MEIIEKHNLVLIEDNCESLGSKYKDKYLGTFGQFGTTSFFFSHHMTTGEGGMVLCHKEEHYYLLLSMRAHGWSRTYPEEVRHKLESESSNVDNRFLFVNTGYNFRPLEIEAAMGLVQLKKLKK